VTAGKIGRVKRGDVLSATTQYALVTNAAVILTKLLSAMTTDMFAMQTKTPNGLSARTGIVDSCNAGDCA
jgi:hypothetical protein